MVEELKFLDQFKGLGIEEVQKNKDGVLVVNIPLDKIDEFVDLSLKLMNPGRWNEYVGPTTGFYFKMPTGEKLHFLIDGNGFNQIVRTLKVFLPSWKLTSEEDLWKWLASIDIYSDWLNEV